MHRFPTVFEESRLCLLGLDKSRTCSGTGLYLFCKFLQILKPCYIFQLGRRYIFVCICPLCSTCNLVIQPVSSLDVFLCVCPLSTVTTLYRVSSQHYRVWGSKGAYLLQQDPCTWMSWSSMLRFCTPMHTSNALICTWCGVLVTPYKSIMIKILIFLCILQTLLMHPHHYFLDKLAHSDPGPKIIQCALQRLDL